MSHAMHLTPETAQMDVPAFLRWSGARDGKWELVDGVPRAMAPASRSHGSIQSELGRLVGNWLAEARPGCAIVTEGGIVPRIASDTNYRVPDLVVSCTPDTPERHDVEGPVVVIEVLSPSNQLQTWANMWAYSTIPSVLELLVVESSAISARLFRREKDGTWPTIGLALAGDDELVLESIGFVTPLRALYRTTRFAQP